MNGELWFHSMREEFDQLRASGVPDIRAYETAFAHAVDSLYRVPSPPTPHQDTAQ